MNQILLGLFELVEEIQGIMGFDGLEVTNVRISNANVTHRLGYRLNLAKIKTKFPKAYYEPEMSIGCSIEMKIAHPKSTVDVFGNGSINLKGVKSKEDAHMVIDQIKMLTRDCSIL